MFGRCVRILYCFLLCLLVSLLIIYVHATFAIPNPYAFDINSQGIDPSVPSLVPVQTWTQVNMSLGKDHLNNNHSTNIRKNILKSIMVVAVAILILMITGGIISVIVYRVKKKFNRIIYNPFKVLKDKKQNRMCISRRVSFN